MPIASPTAATAPSQPDPDDRVFMNGVDWWQYEAMLAIRGERATPRMTYLEGQLELMSPSRTHEGIKTTLARLLEAWAEEKNVVLEGYGSMTMRSAPKRRGLEPDECYAIGAPKESPDLAIEVIWTSGGIDKLDVYRGLGVREVWLWQHDRIEVHVLRAHGYEQAPRSEVLPELDVTWLAGFLRFDSQTEAVRALRTELRR